MGWELFVGLRYLRSRRREKFVSVITVISTVSVLLGVMVLTIVLAVMTGFEEDLRSRILGLNPHIRLVDRLSGGSIREPARFVAAVEEHPEVLAAAPVVTAQMLVAANGRLMGVIGRGVEVTGDSIAIGILDFVVEGAAAELGVRHENEGAELPGVMIGVELSRRTGVRLGETLTLMVPSMTATPFGAIPRSRRFIVVALYDSGMIEYDSGLVYLGIDDARTLLRLDEVATGVEAVLRDPYDAPRVAAELNERIGMPYWAQSWTEVHRNVFEALQLEKTVYFLVLLLIILVAAFTIVASLYMIVMEKRRDVAVLKSMGATDGSIALIFVLKGLLIGGLGTFLGVALGYLACVLLGRYEFIDLPEGVFYVSTVPVRIVPANFAVVAACSIVICLAATLFPAWKAGRVVPIDVL
ncbi:MAG: FtsX-like permease family protein, partial [Candidatus Binatia bacterium]